jgi:hypothetical protein
MDNLKMIDELREHADRCTKAADILEGRRKPSTSVTTSVTAEPAAAAPGKRHMSAAGKRRIAAAQRARWAKIRRSA